VNKQALLKADRLCTTINYPTSAFFTGLTNKRLLYSTGLNAKHALTELI
jgi:hypothetical protein